MYPISEKAVRNWIAAAKEGKLELALYEKGDKTYIANTSQNAAIIEKLVEERRKFVNSRGRKTVKPKSEFYEIYNKDQIFDIITNLETYGEIPLKYSYFNGGAEYWDKYAQKLANEGVPNILNRTEQLLNIEYEYISHIIDEFDQVNVIDVGPGNGLPAKGFLEKLLSEKRLNRYIALDISRPMLEIVQKNMLQWFGNDLKFEAYEKDISQDRFKDILGVDVVSLDGKTTCNIILVLGGIMANFRSPADAWRTIHSSMGKNDVLIYADKLDSETAKRFFDFNPDPDVIESLSPRHRLVLDYLNIDESMYNVERYFDEQESCRVIQIRFTIALTILFEFEGSTHQLNFDKGDTILIFRARQQESPVVLRQIQENGFNPLQISETRDHEYILTISEIQSK